MLIIGVTGGLGTGKTTVARMLRRFGARVLDADKIAREAIKNGGRAYEKIVRKFGKGISSGRRIVRSKLAAVVFKDKEMLKSLNQIIHPIVVDEIKREIRSIQKSDPDAAVVIDAPLLVEAKVHGLADKVVVVKANRRQQLERSCRRLGISQRDAIGRMRSQLPLRSKIRIADYVIDNSKGIHHTQRQVGEIWKELTGGKRWT